MGYYNTFIMASDDCPVASGTIPEARNGKRAIACIQFDLLSGNPYQHTEEDFLFQTFLMQNHITEENLTSIRDEFFSKPKACLRASPLVKKYGWGLHYDAEGKIAMFGIETSQYQELGKSTHDKVLKGMRSKRT